MTTIKQLPPWAFQPQERAFAKAAGEKTYFTGRPCKYGHVVQRCTSSGVCVECSKTIQKRTLQKKLALNLSKTTVFAKGKKIGFGIISVQC